VAQATADSVNTVYAQLLERVGPDAVVDAAHTLGISSELSAHPSIALGAQEVSVQEMAHAYLTLADDGNLVEPYAIARIEDGDGDVVWEPDLPGLEQVIEPEIARAVTHALRGVIDGGTGTAADIGRPAAGKTGTTQDNVDAWFAGYVPGYAAVVWMGYPEGSQPMDDVHGRAVTGGAFPAEIWGRFMTAALEGREVAEFEDPPDELLGAGEGQAGPSTTGGSSTSSSSSSSTSSSSSSTSTSSPDDATTSTTGGQATTTTTEAPTTTAPPPTTTTAPPDEGGGGGGGGGGGNGGGGGGAP
jgi:membrane peptidoglycan carboxypeptidase